MDYLEKFTGGNPEINFNDLDRVPDSNQSFIEAFLKPIFNYFDEDFYSGLTIQGCEVAIGTNISIAEGYVIIKDGSDNPVLVKVDAQSITYNASSYYYIEFVESTDVNGTKVFVDGQTRQTWIKKRGVLTENTTQSPVKYDSKSQNQLNDYLMLSKRTELGYTEKEVNIGSWDMNTTTSVTVNHNVSATEWKTIRDISVIIINNNNDSHYDISFISLIQDGANDANIGVINSSGVFLNRRADGLFGTDTSFSGTSNRGYIKFSYKPD